MMMVVVVAVVTALAVLRFAFHTIMILWYRRRATGVAATLGDRSKRPHHSSGPTPTA